MGNRKRILVSSILILAGSMFCAGALAIALLYQTAFEEEQAHLVELARGQVRLIEAIVRHDEKYN